MGEKRTGISEAVKCGFSIARGAITEHRFGMESGGHVLDRCSASSLAPSAFILPVSSCLTLMLRRLVCAGSDIILCKPALRLTVRASVVSV